MIDYSQLAYPKGKTRLKGTDLRDLRRACFERDRWRCVDCGHGILWHTGHMAHIKSRGAGGPDEIGNVRTKCEDCHRKEHQGK